MMNHRLHRFTKLITQILILVTGYCLLVTICSAQSISSSDLINNAKQYDGKTVAYSGEVIGDVMLREDFAWVNLHDAKNAIGIWVPKELTRVIKHTGNYKEYGDWLEAGGEFHRSCPEHGGDLDIHARQLSLITEGKFKTEVVNKDKEKIVFVYLGVGICLWMLRKLTKKSKKT